MRRVDQDHAATAAAMLEGIAVDATLRTRYRTLRVMSHTAGLASTYAYVASKSKGQGSLPTAYCKVRDGMCGRLLANGWLDPADTRSASAVLARLGALDTVDYLAASADATTLLGWLARLADALAPDPDGPDVDE
jgi:hypothetical protein